MTWQTSWHRKHSMHFRNSCPRSMSSCIIRYVPSGSGGRGLNAGICLRRLVVEGHVGDEVLDQREGLDRRHRDRLALGEDVHPRHAHEPRLAVDLGAARAALAGLAVPAAARSFAWVAWIRWMTSSTTMPSSTAPCSPGTRRPSASPRKTRIVISRVARRTAASFLLLEERLQLGRHLGQAAPASRSSCPSRIRDHDVDLPEVGVGLRDSRRGCGRRGSPCARAPPGRSPPRP